MISKILNSQSYQLFGKYYKNGMDFSDFVEIVILKYEH